MISLKSSSNSLISSAWLKAQRFGALSIITLTAIALFPSAAKAQIQVDGTTATEVKGNIISPTGTGTANGGNLYNSFDKFNVPSSGVIFNTGTSSVDGTKVNNIINRVTGETPSSILGTIQSRSAFPNANLFLLNPNGVVFGTNARLDIGGSFHVTTGTGLGFDQNQLFSVDKNSLNFPSGDVQNIQFAIAQPAAIINQGNLSVDAGKNISFTAGSIVNTGVLTAPSGNVTLTAVSGGSLVDLRSPDLVLGLSVLKNAIPTNWNGTISALPKLAELLTGQAAQANQVVVKPDGSIALVASPSAADIVVKDGMAIASGKIDVSSNLAKGGNVGIFGNQVGLVNSLINASGNTGGGIVLVGGNIQGKGITPQAEFTTLDKNSKIQADAISRGDGGRVAIWSTNTTNVEGFITAKGGIHFGNGGFIETSSKKFLSITSIPNASAKNGLTGTWLIDPTDITIVSTGGALGTNTVGADLINTALNTGTNVTIDTSTASGIPGSGDITQNAGAAILKTAGTDATLTLNAQNNISLNDSITSTSNRLNLNIIGDTDGNGTGAVSISGAISTNGGDIQIKGTNSSGIFNAGSGVLITATVSSGGGNITIDGRTTSDQGFNSPASGFDRGIDLSDIFSGGGAINLIGSSVAGNSVVTGAYAIVTFGQINSGGGDINFTAISPSRGITISNNSFLDAGNGNITLTADSVFPGAITLGSGSFTLQPLTPSTSIGIGASATGNFNLSFLGYSGFNSITVGRSDGSGAINVVGNIAIDSPVTLRSQSGSINTLNASITGNQSLTLSAGSGNVTLGAIGNITTSLGDLSISSGITTFNNPVFANTITNTSANAIINGNITATGVQGNGINLGNITINGNISLTGDEINLVGNATGTGNLILSPFSVGQAIAISGANDTGNTTLDITTTDLFALSGSTLGSLTIGNPLGSGAITLAGNTTFNQPTTIQSPAGNGTINTSGFDLTNTGGSLTLLANQNITTNNITAAGNAIAITSTSGAIDTTGGLLTSNGGIGKTGGTITLNAGINAVTAGIDAGGTAGGGLIQISAINIDTTAGTISSSSFPGISPGPNGNGGNAILNATGNITTARIDVGGGSNANNSGNITITSTNGFINTSAGPLVTRTALGNGGNITLQAQGNITTNGVWTYVDGTGANGNSGNISLTSQSGSIDNSLGQLLSYNATGNGTGNSGNISLNALNGNISTGNLIDGNTTSTSASSNAGSLTVNGLNIASIGNINLSANGGKAGDITLSGNLPLSASTTFSTNSGSINGNINLGNATVTGNQSLTLNAGNGNVTLRAIGTSTTPLVSLDITSGNTALNNNIFTTNALTFNSPVSLLGNAALTTTNSTIAFNNTINGSQALSLDAGTNSIFFNDIVGGVIPLASLAIAPSSTLTSINNLDIRTIGNITTGSIANQGRNISIASTSGAINTSFGNLTTVNASGNAGNILYQAAGNITTGNITTFAFNGNAGSISLNSFGGTINTSLGLLNSTSNNGNGGDIIINATNGNIVTSSFIFARTLSTNPLSTAGSISLDALNLTINGNLSSSAIAGTARDITLKGNLPLTLNLTFFTSSNTGTSGNINLANASITGNQSLTLNAGTGNVSIGFIGNISTPLNSLAISSGNTTLNKDIFTTNGLNFSSPVTLASDVLLSANTGGITFGNTINGNKALSLNSGSGNIIFVGAIGTTTNPLGNLSVNSSGNDIFNSSINAASLITDAPGTTQLGGNVTTTGTQTYNDAVNLVSPIQLSTTNSAIAFNSSVIGSQSFTLNTGIGNITFGGAVVGSTSLIANSSGITRFNSTVSAASLTTDVGGTTELNASVTTSGAQTYNDAVNLINAIQLTTTNNAIAFNAPLNGAFDLVLNTNGNFIFASGAIGNTTPLASLAIAPTSTLTSSNGINIITNGNIFTGAIGNAGKSISLTSNTGTITISKNITTANLTGQGGNIALKASGNLATADIDSSSNSNQGGSVFLTSQTGVISTGSINSLGKVGGEIFFNASTAINAGVINSSGTDKAGDVTLDPSGDVVVQSIDASSFLQGGNVTLVSTGGNLRITNSILSSLIASCTGSSICTSGGTGGSISLQTGGLNPFIVGDPSINGSIGILTTGLSTIALNTSIPAVFGKIFIEGGISVAPGTLPAITTTTFDPPPTSPPIINNDPKDETPIGASDIYKKEVDRYLSEGNLEKAFEAIENAYNSELQAYSGNKLDFTGLTLEKAQDELQIVAERTGDVASLIYPILLDNRIEILVIPPKGTGKPFRRFSTTANQATVEALITDYRNNLRDVGSNDYLEQSQKLYDLIIRPIDSQLTAMKIKTLVFVMDSGLRVSPPAALHDGKQFLIERYAIANLPTMRAARIEERDRKAIRVLAMGLTESREEFGALPSVDIEIKTIASNVLSGTSFLNKDFTVSNLQNQRTQGIYNILHLGTHAKFVSETNQDSFIQFWDSRLKLSQIPNLRFDNPVIDMLTLSACQTAVGNNLGISGLAVESGAKSVLASLWEVSDAGTAPLMISFYKAFPEAVNKAQAIQKAQISLLNGTVKIQGNQIVGIEGFPNIPLPLELGSSINLSHPFYWSSFILVGNWL